MSWGTEGSTWKGEAPTPQPSGREAGWGAPEAPTRKQPHGWLLDENDEMKSSQMRPKNPVRKRLKKKKKKQAALCISPQAFSEPLGWDSPPGLPLGPQVFRSHLGSWAYLSGHVGDPPARTHRARLRRGPAGSMWPEPPAAARAGGPGPDLPASLTCFLFPSHFILNVLPLRAAQGSAGL